MTFWNDLLRNDYAGTGFIDGGRAQITGWLYDALLKNKPYDVFVRELISPTPESEGFAKGIIWRGQVNASQRPSGENLMRIAPPAKADTLRKKQLFEGAMRLRYRVLLEKGLDMMNGTVRMANRTGESSAWVSRAQEAQRALESALADEKAALEKMPFTEAELRAELEALKKKP